MSGVAAVEAAAAEASRAVEALRNAALDAVYKENGRGGEARKVVSEIARQLGFMLSYEPLDGEIWGVRNMGRVTNAVKALVQENRKLKGLPDAFH